MKIRTLLVDGNYLLKRSISGADEVYTNSFGHIGGLYQFFIKLRSLITKHMITKVVIMWDGENGGVLRHRLDPKYKANRTNKSWYQKIEMSDAEIKREEMKRESILKQRKRIQAYAEELFLRQIEVDQIEADDLIASYCMKYNNKEEIFIFTNDRDFAQLLDLNITIIFSNIEDPVTRSNFYFHFKYTYQNALSYKILCGDTSDNIDGVEGLQLKTIIKYFPDFQFKYMSVKEILQKAQAINDERASKKMKPLKVMESLVNSIDRLKLNYTLINLKEPFLNDEAMEELLQLDLPLSPEGRSSKNLLNMMQEDEFLTIYNGTFVNLIEPFYTVIMGEKQLLNEYNRGKK